MKVRIRKRHNPLHNKPFWSLWRVSDGKLEASGMLSENEAVMYAAISGYEVVA